MNTRMKNFIVKNSFIKRSIALMLVMLMFVMLIPSDLRLRAADEDENTIFKDTSIVLNEVQFSAKYKDADGKEQNVSLKLEQANEIPSNAEISLRFDFLLQDGSQVKDGQDYVYKIPDGITVHENATHPLTVDGAPAPVGQVVISKDGTLTFNFYTDVIKNDQGVKFYVGFGGGLSSDLKEEGSEAQIKFPAGDGSFDFHVISKGEIIPEDDTKPAAIETYKSGSFMTGTDGKKYIEWKVSLHHTKGEMFSGDIQDALPAGLKYVSGTVNGQKYPYANNNKYGQGTPVITDTTTGNNVNLHVDNCYPDYMTDVYFLTEYNATELITGDISANNKEITVDNTAVFTPTDTTIPGSTPTTTLKKQLDVLDKTAPSVDKDGNITWQIVVNKEKLNIGGAVLTDTAVSNISGIVGDIEAFDENGNTYTGITVSKGTTGFTWTAPPDFSNTIIFKYKTSVTSATVATENKVNLTGTKINYDDTATVQPANVLSKTGMGYDPISQTLTWKIVVNEDKRNLTNVVVKDIFDGSKMELVIVSPDNLTYSTLENQTETVNGSGLTTATILQFDMENISDRQEITVVTKLKEDVVNSSYTGDMYNRSTLSSTEINADKTANQYIQVKKPDVASKEGRVLNADSGKLEWYIELKGQAQAPNEYVIKDELPSNMNFVEGSFRIQSQWYDGSPVYVPVTPVVENGKTYIEYTFNASTNLEAAERFLKPNTTFWMLYETTPKFMDDAMQQTTYTNKANVTVKFPGNVEYSEDVDKTVNEKLGGLLGKDVASVNGREVKWNIKINPARTDMSSINNPTITDDLEDYFTYVARSGVLYEVSEDGTRTPVDASKYTIAVIDNRMTVKLPKINNSYFEFEFLTRVLVDEAVLGDRKINNKVSLNGEGTIVQKQSQDVTNIDFASSMAGASVQREIRVKKVDENGNPLQGAVFELYLPTEDGKGILIGKAVSGDDGFAKFVETDTLEGYELILKETETPTGYKYVDGTSEMGDVTTDGVTVIKNFKKENIKTDKNGQYYPITIENESITPNSVTLKLKKVDADNSDTVIAGAEYGLYKADGTTLVGTTKVTDDTGMASFTVTEDGTYYIKEIASPEGYKLSADAVKADVTVSTKTVKYTYPAATGTTVTSTDGTPVTVKDEKATAKFKITKILSGSKTNEKIKGVRFAVYLDQACRVKVAEKTTNENGVVEFGNLTLGKTYWYREESAPDLYVLDQTVKSFTIGTGTETTDQSKSVNVYNSLKTGSVVITKTDDQIPASPLKGVTFVLYTKQTCAAGEEYKPDGTNPYTVTTDDNGVARFEDLPFGTYYIKETDIGSNNVKINTTPIKVVVDESGDNEVSVKNEAVKFSVKITKTNDDGEFLQGVLFGIYNDSGLRIMQGRTDSKGVVEFNDIVLGEYDGDYHIKEMGGAPDGYKEGLYIMGAGGVLTAASDADLTIKHDDIIRGYNNISYPDTKFIVAKNFINRQESGKIHLKKVDKDSGDALAGAEFTLYDENGFAVATAVSMTGDQATTLNNTGAYTGITFAEGSIYFGKEIKIDSSPVVYLSKFVNGDKKLKYGTYTLKETKAPVDAAGKKVYMLNETEYILTISDDSTITSVSVKGAASGTNVDKITNEKQPDELPIVSFKLKKVDDTGKPVAGAKFEMTKKVPGASGFTAMGAGINITSVSDANGMVYFRRVSIKDDPDDTIYRIAEVSTPTGYKMTDGTAYEITKKEFVAEAGKYKDNDDSHSQGADVPIRADADINYLHQRNADGSLNTGSELSVKNDRLLGTIEVRKQGAAGNIRLEGAEFALCDKTGKKLIKINGSEVKAVTDKNGVALFTDLPFDTYYIKETKAPDGYTKTNEIKTVIVDQEYKSAGAEITTFIDNRINIYISKQDFESKAEVAGAHIRLSEKIKGRYVVIDEWVSGKTPYLIDYKKLKADGATVYKLEETSAPNGYGYTVTLEFKVDFDGTLKDITLNTGNVDMYSYTDNALILYDKPLHLAVKKVSAGTPNTPLSGATLSIYDADNMMAPIYTWTTGETGVKDVSSKIPVPETGEKLYVIKEKFAPTGYMLAEDIYFVVDAEAKVYNYTGGGKGSEITPDATTNIPTIVMKDTEKTGIFLSKIDDESYAEIEGATLALYDMSATPETKVGESWTSGKEKQFIVSDSPTGTELNSGHKYKLVEEKAPEGYLAAEPVTFEFVKEPTSGKYKIKINSGDATLTYDGDTLLMHDKRIELNIAKQDSYGAILEGAELEIYKCDADGKKLADTPFQTFTSPARGTMHVEFTELAINSYYRIHEVKAPDGFGIADDIVVFIDGDGTASVVMTISKDEKAGYDKLPRIIDNTVYMIDKDNVVSIGKLDADEQKVGNTVRVENSKLQLTSAEDKYFETVTWSSDDKYSESFEMAQFTPGYTYTLTEIGAPDGYAYTDPINFKIDKDTRDVYIVNEDNTLTKAPNRTVYIADAKININVAKTDKLTGEFVKGARFEVYDKTGAVVSSWTSSGNVDKIDTSKLKVGGPEENVYEEYTLKEVKTPEDYEKSDEVITFALDRNAKMYIVTIDEDGTKQYTEAGGGDIFNLIKIENMPKFKISKTDIKGVEVPNATLTIYAKDSSVEFEPITWSTGETVGKPKYISKDVFTPNVEYILSEVAAPNGYVYAGDITFSFDENGVLYVDGVKMDGTNEINMVDELISVSVSKQDSESGNDVKGATLAIKNSEGELLFTFESDIRHTSLPTEKFTVAKEGLTYYTLEEISAPEGYLMAKPVRFAIDSKGNVYVADEAGEYKPVADKLVVMLEDRDPTAPPNISKLPKAPNTGDTIPIVPVAVLMLAACVGIVYIIRRKLMK